MRDEIHDQLIDGDGNPVFEEDGTPVTWFDLMACVGDIVRGTGLEMDTKLDPVTGERSYALTGPAIGQIRAVRAKTGCSLEEAVKTLGIDFPFVD